MQSPNPSAIPPPKEPPSKPLVFGAGVGLLCVVIGTIVAAVVGSIVIKDTGIGDPAKHYKCCVWTFLLNE